MASLKKELFKALVVPFLEDFGKAAAKEVAKRLWNHNDDDKDEEEEEDDEEELTEEAVAFPNREVCQGDKRT